MNALHPHSVGESHAWIERARCGLPRRPASERISDFREIYGLYDEAVAREQASRCLQCPDPVCVEGCPIHARIPEWLELTAEGRTQEAASLVLSTNTLAEICAKACPADHLCEAHCIVTGHAAPVAIWAIEQFLIEYALAQGTAQEPNAPANGRRVAVLGAGPGGLAFADELAKRGFAVTVFDERPKAGGMLVYGTPAFRLDPSLVERRVDLLRQRGVEFRLGARLGRDAREELLSRFDGIYLGLGASRPRTLDLPGCDLKGIHQAQPFIAQPPSASSDGPSPVNVAGQRVVVLGAGDTAIDCLRTAVRCGAREAVGIYRRDEDHLPCSRREYQNAREEGVRFLFQAMPVAFRGDAEGHVVAVTLRRTVPGERVGDRREFTPEPGTEHEVCAERVFLALGFVADPCPQALPFDDLRRTADGRLWVDEHQMTSRPGVVAGGDLVNGPSTPLETVRDARRAAAGLMAYLSR